MQGPTRVIATLPTAGEAGSLTTVVLLVPASRRLLRWEPIFSRELLGGVCTCRVEAHHGSRLDCRMKPPAVLLRPAFISSPGPDDHGVFISSDGGSSWTPVNSGLPNGDHHFYSFTVTGPTAIVAGGGEGVYLSTNNGVTWTWIDRGLPAYAGVNAITGTDSNFIAGTTDSGVYVSSTNGGKWRHAGLSGYSVSPLRVSYGYLFAGTSDFVYGHGVWCRPISELITRVEKNKSGTPTGDALSQNHPNPFNPSTMIKYRLPVTSRMALKIYDILGREVKSLVNEEEKAGEYEVRFNGTGLASGVYFYKMIAVDKTGQFFESDKKMVIIE